MWHEKSPGRGAPQPDLDYGNNVRWGSQESHWSSLQRVTGAGKTSREAGCSPGGALGFALIRGSVLFSLRGEARVPAWEQLGRWMLMKGGVSSSSFKQLIQNHTETKGPGGKQFRTDWVPGSGLSPGALVLGLAY